MDKSPGTVVLYQGNLVVILSENVGLLEVREIGGGPAGGGFVGRPFLIGREQVRPVPPLTIFQDGADFHADNGIGLLFTSTIRVPEDARLEFTLWFNSLKGWTFEWEA